MPNIGTTAACCAATAGSTSGSGLASANTIGSSVIVASSAAPNRFGALTPMNTSAPFSASASEPVFRSRLVCAAIATRWSSRPGRSGCTIPSTSTAITSAVRSEDSSRMIADPAAPTPHTTTRTSANRFPTTRNALRSAPSTTTAVPCWSSWNTGMSSSSRSRLSISKQRGAAMSSRLIPP